MRNEIYLHLLLLCGVCIQGITKIFANEDIRIFEEKEYTSDILIRQKRVVSRIPGEDKAFTIHMLPYVVRIKENRRTNCVGSIVSHRVVITVAACVMYEVSQYFVVSGSSHITNAFNNNVKDIRKNLFNHPNRHTDGIALLIVETPFVYGSFTDRIQLHSGPLLPGTLGTISGWGYCFRGDDKGTKNTQSLRSIQVPIMAHRDCVNIYRRFNIQIYDYDICTYHPQKHCGHSDGGAPLVVDGFLAGLHLWTGPNRTAYNLEYPDVFVILQHPEFNQWISSNIANIEAQFRNRHN